MAEKQFKRRSMFSLLKDAEPKDKLKLIMYYNAATHYCTKHTELTKDDEDAIFVMACAIASLIKVFKTINFDELLKIYHEELSKLEDNENADDEACKTAVDVYLEKYNLKK